MTHGLTALPVNLTVNWKALKFPNNSGKYEKTSRNLCSSITAEFVGEMAAMLGSSNLGDLDFFRPQEEFGQSHFFKEFRICVCVCFFLFLFFFFKRGISYFKLNSAS